MAKHRKRRHHMGRHKRRRHMRGFMGLGALGLEKSAEIKDVAVGAGAGLAATAAIKLLLSSVPSLQLAVPDLIANNAALLGPAIAGGGLYLFEHKKSPSKALGHVWGAVIAGGAAWLWQTLQASAPATFGDVVTVDLGRGAKAKQLKGLIVGNKSGYVHHNYNGLLVGNKSPGFPIQDGFSGYGSLIAPNPIGTTPGDFSSFMQPDDDPMEEQYAT